MAYNELSAGAIKEIRLNKGSTVFEPVLQCLSTKIVENQGMPDRWRGIMSDGETFLQSMFATGINHQLAENEVRKNSVLRILEYSVNQVKDRIIMIMHRVEVLHNPETKIGEPVNVEQVLADEGQANGHQDQQQEEAPANAYQPNAAGRGGRGGAAGAARGGRGGAAASRGGRTTSATSNTSASHPIYPIEGLSPYQNKWTIKARVTNKSDIRHWSNPRGQGKLFSFNLLDETGEIKATAFNDAVDAFYNVIEDGKVYLLSKARITIAKKQFSNVNNEYEISLEPHSEISLCTDAENVPQVKYEFVQLGDLQEVEPNSMCDVIAIVKEVGDVSQIVSKATQKPVRIRSDVVHDIVTEEVPQITKRELILVDPSDMSVRLTLWGRTAENFNAAGQDGDAAPVIAFKGVKVGDFGGRSLSMVSSSSMMVDPDIPEAHALRGWYDGEGAGKSFKSFNSVGGAVPGGGSMRPENFKTTREIMESAGNSEQQEIFCVRAAVLGGKRDGTLTYPACPTCNKKVSQEGNDAWRCEKCDRTYPAPVHRYVARLQFNDSDGAIHASCFNEVGELIFGVTGDELENMRGDESYFESYWGSRMGRYYDLLLKAGVETYNDEARLKLTVVKAVPAPYKGDVVKRLIATINSYSL